MFFQLNIFVFEINSTFIFKIRRELIEKYLPFIKKGERFENANI